MAIDLTAQTLALYHRGATLFKKERYADAVAAYDAVLALSPQNTTALYEKGIALTHLSPAFVMRSLRLKRQSNRTLGFADACLYKGICHVPPRGFSLMQLRPLTR